VHSGRSILYKIEVDTAGRIRPEAIDSPARGQYAFQTDILVSKAKVTVPLVVIETKVGTFSSHDVIVYSSKAARHKLVYPYLRYGFLVIGVASLGRRFATHNSGFNFAMAAVDVISAEQDFVQLVRNQLASAERICELMDSGQGKLSRYEEIVRIT
jgi:hypothetical protein